MKVNPRPDTRLCRCGHAASDHTRGTYKTACLWCFCEGVEHE